MDAEVMDSLHEISDSHWWNRSRKRIVLSLLERYARNRDGVVLDMGCGTGNHLGALGRFGEVWGADSSTQALDYCRRLHNGRLDLVRIPDEVPYEPSTFSVITMLDVLEHIEDDQGALGIIHDLVKPGGTILLTVPAFNWLWTRYDEHACHFRRYRRRQLGKLLTKAGFEIRVLSYYNFFLFPPVVLSKLCAPGRFWSPSKMVHRGNGILTRHLFEAIFSFERHILARVRFPIGASLIAVASRPSKN